MKVYLAARYGRLEEMRDYRTRLLERGHQVTSRWLKGEHQIAHDGKSLGTNREQLVESQDDRDVALKAHFAQEDIADLRNADVVVAFTEATDTKGRGRGGRHVEFGMAVALNSFNGVPELIILVGPRENVFYCLPSVQHMATFDEALALLDTRFLGGSLGDRI